MLFIEYFDFSNYFVGCLGVQKIRVELITKGTSKTTLSTTLSLSFAMTLQNSNTNMEARNLGYLIKVYQFRHINVI